MKLYFSKGSCSLASRIAINELALDCQYEKVDIKTSLTESGMERITSLYHGHLLVLISI